MNTSTKFRTTAIAAALALLAGCASLPLPQQPQAVAHQAGGAP